MHATERGRTLAAVYATELTMHSRRASLVSGAQSSLHANASTCCSTTANMRLYTCAHASALR